MTRIFLQVYNSKKKFNKSTKIFRESESVNNMSVCVVSKFWFLMNPKELT